jgi:hypothetical protein
VCLQTLSADYLQVNILEPLEGWFADNLQTIIAHSSPTHRPLIAHSGSAHRPFRLRERRHRRAHSNGAHPAFGLSICRLSIYRPLIRRPNPSFANSLVPQDLRPLAHCPCQPERLDLRFTSLAEPRLPRRLLVVSRTRRASFAARIYRGISFDRNILSTHY